MSSQPFNFVGYQDQLRTGQLDLPPENPRAFALFTHCFMGTERVLNASRISQRLCSQGYAVLRLDSANLAADEIAHIQDLLAASKELAHQYDIPQLLIGHSLAGTAMLAAANEIPNGKAVVLIGAPLPDASTQTLAQKLAALNRPLLIFHSIADEQVPISHAEKIYEIAKQPKSFITLEQADHLLSQQSDVEYITDTLVAWASRFFPPEEPHASLREIPVEINGDVFVQERGTGGFEQVINIGPHELIGDEPVAVGGNNHGPNPYDFLLAALGTCTSMTLRMYAKNKGFPLEHVEVRLHHDKIHAQDCRSCETKTGKIDRITRTIHLRGSLTTEQQNRLYEIADKCPVHRTLRSEILIETKRS